MIKIVTKELEFDKELKKKIEFVCDFCNTVKIKTKMMILKDSSVIIVN